MNNERDSIQTIEHEIALLLRRVEAARKALAQIDRASYLLLDALAVDGPQSISALAQLFQLDISTLSRQTAGLEAGGLVMRITDPDDGRVSVLQLTPEGMAQLQASRALRYELYSRLLEGWSEEDRHAFGTYLRRFNETVSDWRSKVRPAEQDAAATGEAG